MLHSELHHLYFKGASQKLDFIFPSSSLSDNLDYKRDDAWSKADKVTSTKKLGGGRTTA